MENLYDILEVSRKASKEVIDKAYKTLAKKYHPDLQAPENKQMAEEKMKKINEAYSVLSDDVQRARYDRELEEEENNRQKIILHNKIHMKTRRIIRIITMILTLIIIMLRQMIGKKIFKN